MDVAALQEVAKILESLSGDTKELFIWYIVAVHGKGLVLGVMGICVAIFGIVTLKNGICTIVGYCTGLDQIMAMFNKRFPYSALEINEACALIRMYQQKGKE